MIRVAFALCAMALAGESCAQISGSVTLVSDYRYRGVTLSAEKPAAQASVAYDHDSGWYAGGFASTAAIVEKATRLQTVAFAGYARRLGPGLSWDAGASFTSYSGLGEYRYGEVYCGLAADKLNGRIYYASNYFGQGARAVYAEINGTLPLRDRLRLIGHLGALHTDNRGPNPGSRVNRFDWRAGAGLVLDWANIELTWVAISPASAAYPAAYGRDRNSVVLSVSRAF